jgi:hypothetical protein
MSQPSIRSCTVCSLRNTQKGERASCIHHLVLPVHGHKAWQEWSKKCIPNPARGSRPLVQPPEDTFSSACRRDHSWTSGAPFPHTETHVTQNCTRSLIFSRCRVKEMCQRRWSNMAADVYGLLGYNAVLFLQSSMFRRHISSPCSGSKSKPSKKRVEASDRLVLCLA